MTYVLAAAVGLCIAALVYQSLEIRTLKRQMSEQSASLTLASSDAAAARALSEEQASRIERLERSATGKLDPPPVGKLQALRPGLYELTTSTPYDPEAGETAPYVITHVLLELQYETYRRRLHVGLARAGMAPKGVYFDYDNDGRIDVDMALDFVRDIPVFGRSLAKAYDPVIAQNLYSIFIDESENAEYTSVDDLDAEEASNYLWKFLQDRYEAIRDWVLEHLKDEPEAQEVRHEPRIDAAGRPVLGMAFAASSAGRRSALQRAHRRKRCPD